MVHGDDQYMPRNRSAVDSKAMGESFEMMMKKNKKRLDRKINRAMQRQSKKDLEDDPETLEALIRCDDLNQQSEVVDSGLDDSDVNEETEVEESDATSL